MIRKKIKAVVFVLLFISAAPHSVLAQPDLLTLDGQVNRLERQTFRPIIANGQSIILLKQGEGFISMAVISEPLYVASLCICSEDGERVTVLHASAALGSIDFRLNGDRWEKASDFDWSMRDASMTDRALNERRAYLGAHSWVATTMPMGSKGTVEFLLDRDLIGDNKFYLAAGLMPESDPDRIIALPGDGAGACGAPGLVAGSPEQSYSFRPELWHEVDLIP